MSADTNAVLADLFREAFEGRPPGVPSWFVEREDGLIPLLSDLSAEDASKVPAPGLNTIGGHAFHVRYILRITNGLIQGKSPMPDWVASWAQQRFTEAEWDELRASLKDEYLGVLAFFESDPQWPNKDWLLGAMALLPHMAYHVGAVRQLKAVVISG